MYNLHRMFAALFTLVLLTGLSGCSGGASRMAQSAPLIGDTEWARAQKARDLGFLQGRDHPRPGTDDVMDLRANTRRDETSAVTTRVHDHFRKELD